VDDRLGTRVPTDVVLVDQLGHTTELGALLDGEHTLVIVPAYYRCPMLCGLTIASVAEALAQGNLVPGDGFRVATVSFDPRDGAADAERARARAIELFGAHVDDRDWGFFAGEPHEVARLLDAIGFRYAWDEATEQYAHPSAIFFVTPSGRLARVLGGVDVAPVDLRLAVLEAGEGRVGTLAEQSLLTCFRFDPVTRRYRFFVLGFLRIGGLVLLGAFGIGFAVLVRRDRARSREAER
jgi:protein SCO1/2